MKKPIQQCWQYNWPYAGQWTTNRATVTRFDIAKKGQQKPVISNQQHAQLINLMLRAGREVLRLRDQGLLNVRRKPDNSFITDADIAVHNMMRSELPNICRNMPIVSEEDEVKDPRGAYTNAIVLDPVDCTGALTRGERGFSILMGFVVDHMPVGGYIYYPDPRVSRLYYTGSGGMGAFKQDVLENTPDKIQLGRPTRLNTITVDCPPRVVEVYTKSESLLRGPFVKLGCFEAPGAIAAFLENEADLFAGCVFNDWDIAAFDAVVRAKGGLIVSALGKGALRYGEARDDADAFKQPVHVGGSISALTKTNLII